MAKTYKGQPKLKPVDLEPMNQIAREAIKTSQRSGAQQRTLAGAAAKPETDKQKRMRLGVDKLAIMGEKRQTRTDLGADLMKPKETAKQKAVRLAITRKK